TGGSIPGNLIVQLTVEPYSSNESKYRVFILTFSPYIITTMYPYLFTKHLWLGW
ncbi:hypothetical protein WDU94_011281, partial [Cyamophila willieti]